MYKEVIAMNTFDFDLDDDGYYELSEEDFYPPEDDRILASCVDGFDRIDGVDDFEEYSRWFYDSYGDDVFGDGWKY